VQAVVRERIARKVGDHKHEDGSHHNNGP
jgi:hypothetical protein